MNTKLIQRGAEFAQQLMTYLASFDCMTLNQCCALIYGTVSPAGIATMQRKLKKMMQEALVGREQSGDGLWRYYLLEAGVRQINTTLQFTAKSGSDRSYLNSSRRDGVINRLIKDMHRTENAEAIGPGALRNSAGGKFKNFDGALVITDDTGTKLVRLYAKIGSPSAANVERYQELKMQAAALKTPLTVIAEDYTKTVLGIKK